MKLLVTGSNGFIGSKVVELAESRNWACISHRRSPPLLCPPHTSSEYSVYKQITSDTDWSDILVGIDCIVHCAARVHQMNESEADAKLAYNEVNTLGTLHLARQAAKAGVTRFVFLSSIKVNGEMTQRDESFKPDLGKKPVDPYGLSKFNAEVGLKKIAEETGLEVVIIRPPLVYGPGVKANFHSMMRVVAKGFPLPLGAVNNRRSMVYLDNLVDLILTVCIHKKAAANTFLVSDDNDVSLSYILRRISNSMEKKHHFLISIPPSWIHLAASVIGKPEVAQRLCGNLQLDIQKTKEILEWQPPISFDEGIKRTVDHFIKSINK